jgi:hypothetical protein
MRRTIASLILLALTLSACAGFETRAADLRASLSDIDVKETLSSLSNCDALSDAFVQLVQTAADNVDNLSEVTGGQVPATEIRDVVDELSVSQYYEIAERLGCAKVQMELALVNRILDIDTETADGDLFVEEILKEVQAQGLP